MEFYKQGTQQNNKALEQDNTAAKQLGEYLRDIRKNKNWAINKAAANAGIATSSLSKIENNLMSPTYATLLKLAEGYDVDLASFFQSDNSTKYTGRMVITRQKDAIEHDTPNYKHHLHATGLTDKKMMPFISEIKPCSADKVGLAAHPGEDFVLVISGEVTFYTEYYEPVILEVGDSLYIDSNMKHGAKSNNSSNAKVIWMTSNT